MEEKLYTASQFQLIWWRFRKHRLAVFGGIVLVIIYLMAIFADFLAPYHPNAHDAKHIYAPPQKIRFVGEDGFSLRPFVYGYEMKVDPRTFRRVYTEDRSKVYPLQFLVRGHEYKLLGLIPTDIHLFGTEEGPVFLFGTDRMGRDVLSRILHGARISTSIGLVGVFLSLLIGIIVGGISGYCGGVVDNVVQRIIEFLVSIPTLPLWMGLSAALPPNWPPVRIYFGMTIILSLVGWTGLARVVRSKFLSLREEDFVLAARVVGAGRSRIIMRHMVPSFMSHIVAAVTLSIPSMILSETSLSFLGLGLRPPTISWGVLLQEAQNISTVALYPWLLLPGLFVVVTVLAFNFLGDGLRDAADPYAR